MKIMGIPYANFNTINYCYGKIIKTYRNINKLMANHDFSLLA